jgi:hypothetical protein
MQTQALLGNEEYWTAMEWTIHNMKNRTHQKVFVVERDFHNSTLN